MFIGLIFQCFCLLLSGGAPPTRPLLPCQCQTFAVYQAQNNDGTVREEIVALGE